MSKDTWSIYRHTFPDGKVYIGKTACKPEDRWGAHGRGYSGQEKVFNAILEYGWRNIKHEVLMSGLDGVTASKEEERLIRESDSEGGTGNYNVTYSKRETVPPAITKGGNAIISEASLYRNGRYLLDLPDAFYDKMAAAYGHAPSSVMLETDRAILEVASSDEKGFNIAKYSIQYPRKGMTFDEVADWLVSGDYAATIIEVQSITHEQIKMASASLQEAK